MISVIIPAYNEQNRIHYTLNALINFSVAGEIVVACDGTDNTAEISRAYAENHPRSKILVYEAYRRLGKGGALKEGVKRSSGDEICFMDADLPVSPYCISQFSSMLEHYDCAVGDRFGVESWYHHQPLGRKILSSGYRRLANWILKTKVDDFQCGFKIFRREPLLKVLPDVKCEGFSFDTELLMRLTKANYTFVEMPVEYYYRKGSKVKIGQVFEMFWDLLQIRRDLTNTVGSKEQGS